MATNQSQTNFFKTKGGITFSIIIIVFLLYIAVKVGKSGKAVDIVDENNTTIVQPSPAPESVAAPVVNSDSLEREEWNALEESLEGFKVSDYLVDGGALTPMYGVGQLQEYAEKIENGLNSTNDETVQRAKKLKAKEAKIQISAYPQLRKAWGKQLGKKLWREDIEVKVFGKGNSTIQFTGGLFAANRNIEDFQKELSAALRDMRFKRIQYKWYEGDDEYTYYTMETKPDSEL